MNKNNYFCQVLFVANLVNIRHNTDNEFDYGMHSVR